MAVKWVREANIFPDYSLPDRPAALPGWQNDLEGIADCNPSPPQAIEFERLGEAVIVRDHPKIAPIVPPELCSLAW